MVLLKQGKPEKKIEIELRHRIRDNRSSNVQDAKSSVCHKRRCNGVTIVEQFQVKSKISQKLNAKCTIKIDDKEKTA